MLQRIGPPLGWHTACSKQRVTCWLQNGALACWHWGRRCLVGRCWRSPVLLLLLKVGVQMVGRQHCCHQEAGQAASAARGRARACALQGLLTGLLLTERGRLGRAGAPLALPQPELGPQAWQCLQPGCQTAQGAGGLPADMWSASAGGLIDFQISSVL